MHSHVKKKRASSQGVQGAGVFFQICLGKQPHLPRGVALSTCDRSVTGYLTSVEVLHERRTIAFDTRRATMTCQPQKKKGKIEIAARERLGRAALLRTRGFCISDRDMATGVYTIGLVMTVWTVLRQPGSCSYLAPPVLARGAYRIRPIKQISIR